MLAGRVKDPGVGLVLSTRTVIRAEVNVFPVLSVVMTRRSYWPSPSPVVSQLVWYGLLVTAAPRFENEPLWGATWNWAEATPEPESAELEDTVTLDPRTLALAAGAMMDPVGLVL